MTATYDCIATTTLGSAQSSVTFSSISGSFTDLVLVMVAATTHSSATFPFVQFNSDTGTNYSGTDLYGDGASAGSARSTNRARGFVNFDISISTTVGDSITTVNFLNYSNTTTYKTYLSRANRASSALDYSGTSAFVGLWRNTSAITSILVGNSRGDVDYNFASGSTFTLYGIKAE